MRPRPRRAACRLAIMLAFSLLCVACASPRDPAGAAMAERARPADAATVSTAARERGTSLVIAAVGHVGVPYRPGGNGGERGFDCSGFTRHIYALELGLVLPRSADEQAAARGLAPVDKGDLQPGDLVFFDTLQRTYSHVGIYIGEGRFVHAPRTGSEVRIESMRQAYWAERYTGARRASLADGPNAARTTLLPTTN